MKIFTRLNKKEQRQHLRSEMTHPERCLWSALKDRQILGYKFRRQHSIGAYIADFYCPSEKLVIEVDGDSHVDDGAVEYDHRRDEYLRGFGLTVMRFTNAEVENNLEGVVGAIHDQLSKND